VQADLPHEWAGYRIRRHFRGAIYDITVRRASAGERPGRSVNGAVWTDQMLPIAPAGSVQRVEIAL